MALSYLRLRRALSLSSSLTRYHHHQPPSFSSLPPPLTPPSNLAPLNPSFDIASFQCRSFKSTTALSSMRDRDRSYNNRGNIDDGADKLDPDAVLFEGCDYNHWLITMDFPKESNPSAEEMVETYVQTAAKVFGSVEEAKKRIYACSTTTYRGFQVTISEEDSEKFRGLPGVVFILPDSYIDPVNKEYGGDKYEEGKITHRPPPVQYGRPRRRYDDQNRDFNRPYRPRDSNQQGDSRYDNHGTIQGNPGNFGRQQNFPPPQNSGPRQNFPQQHNFGPQQNFPPQQNFGQQQNLPPQQNFGQQQNLPPQQNFGQQQNLPPQQNFGQQNFGPPRAGEGRDAMSMNNAPGGRGDSPPSYQPNFNQRERGNYHSQEQRDFPSGSQRNYAPPERRDFPPGGQTNYAPPEQRNFGVDNRNYTPPQGGTFGQGVGGAHVQERGSGYGPSGWGHGENQRFSEVEGNNTEGQQRNHAAMGETGTGQ
ncbi:hypothetical protein RJ639_023156, partial [Escallonia herrerae]